MRSLKNTLLATVSLAFIISPTIAMDDPSTDSTKKTLPKQKVSKQPDATEKGMCLEAVFLGPRAENGGMFEALVVDVVRDYIYWRRNFHPEDPTHITEEIKYSKRFLDVKENLEKHLRLMLARLKKSVPFFSLRYQGHMTGETTIPSMIGYIAAMLYNPNNVAFEGSSATSYLEEKAAEDLCKMVGYHILPEETIIPRIFSWGHLTGGGTVANAEALWAARNLKFYPLAVKWALEKDPELKAAKNVKIWVFLRKELSEEPLLSLDTWTLLNIESTLALQLPEDIMQLRKLDQEKEGTKLSEAEEKELEKNLLDDTYKRLAKFSLQNIGFVDFYRKLSKETQKRKEPDIKSPVVIASGTNHYSIPKAVSLLGLGQKCLINIPVDEDGRMDTGILQDTLSALQEARRPVIAVISIMGTTEEGAVDPLSKIIDIRDKYQKENMDFVIHADAAWGGYFAALFREESSPGFPTWKVPVSLPSPYVEAQFRSLKHADSITIDPHKLGYIPYPAGALCYRNTAMKHMVNFTAPYISAREEVEPTIGVFGIEGSKAGAAAAAVYLSHRVIPLNMDGYGKLLGQVLYSTKKFYAHLMKLSKPEDGVKPVNDFIVVPLARLPSEQEGNHESKIQEERNSIIQNAHFSTGYQLDKKIGPDLNVIVYAFNFYVDKEKTILNSNLEKANEFNSIIYEELRPQPYKNVADYDLLVSNTTLENRAYGSKFLNSFMTRLGVKSEDKNPSIHVLRSVIMNPWLTEVETVAANQTTGMGSFLETIEKTLTKIVGGALTKFKNKEATHVIESKL